MHKTSRTPSDEFWFSQVIQAPASPVKRKCRVSQPLHLGLALASLLCLAMLVAVIHMVPREIVSQHLPSTSRGPAVTATPTWRTLNSEVFTVEYPSSWQIMSASVAARLVRTSLEGADLSQITHVQAIAGPYQGDGEASPLVMLLVIENAAYGGGITPKQLQVAEQATRQQLGTRILALERIRINDLPGLACAHVDASQRYVIRNVIIFPPEPGIAYLICCNTPIAAAAETERIFVHMVSTLTISRDALPLATAAPTATPTGVFPSMPSAEARADPPVTMVCRIQR